MDKRGLLDYFMYINNKMEDRKFCFILGAGASVQSGIPTGGELATRWLKVLQRRHDNNCDAQDIEQWATADNLKIKDFDFTRVAEFYPKIYDKLYKKDPDEGYAYLGDVMAGMEPSIGYSILSKILSETQHKVVITTNFDNLVQDALSIYTKYTNTFPLVCGHESLVGFVRTELRCPLITKIHRDLLYAPKSDSAGTSELPPEWSNVLKKLLLNYSPIVIGYGGNDGSFMDFLGSLKKGDIKGGIRWCYLERDGETNDEIKRDCCRTCRLHHTYPWF